MCFLRLFVAISQLNGKKNSWQISSHVFGRTKGRAGDEGSISTKGECGAQFLFQRLVSVYAMRATICLILQPAVPGTARKQMVEWLLPFNENKNEYVDLFYATPNCKDWVSGKMSDAKSLKKIIPAIEEEFE